MGEALDSMDFRPLGELLCPEPEECPDLWPWGARGREDGILKIGGVALSGVAQEFATPLFALDQADLHGRASVWATTVAEEFWDGCGINGGDAFYTGRAFLCSDVVRTVSEVGMGIGTTSLGELTMTVRSGAEPSGIDLRGNNELDSKIELALRAEDDKGIERVFVDSLPEVAQIEAIVTHLNTSVRMMTRVKTGVHTGGNEYIPTGHEDQKLGVGAFGGQLEEVVATIGAAPHLKLHGLHSHIGSRIQGTAAFEEAAPVICPLGKKISEIIGRPVKEIDPGGGAGVTCTGDDEPPTLPVEVVHQIARSAREACARLGMKTPRVPVEPGRSITGPSTVILYRVGAVKDANLAERFTRHCVMVDGGVADNIRLALYGVRYTATLANRVSDTELVRSRVVGKHYESGDIVVWDVDLPLDVRAGDLLAVPVTGAYGYSMASDYNMLTRPGVIAIEDGAAEWIMRPQTVKDLLVLDPGLD